MYVDNNKKMGGGGGKSKTNDNKKNQAAKSCQQSQPFTKKVSKRSDPENGR